MMEPRLSLAGGRTGDKDGVGESGMPFRPPGADSATVFSQEEFIKPDIHDLWAFPYVYYLHMYVYYLHMYIYRHKLLYLYIKLHINIRSQTEQSAMQKTTSSR